jgi:hypothetical protein
MTCPRCYDTRWVCEAHPERPWEGGPRACGCGAPGEPCPICNRPEGDTAPALPEGFVVDTKDWE